MTSEDRQSEQLEAALSALASTLDDTLTEIFGSDRGFVIYVCKGGEGESGEGAMLTNLDEPSVRQLMRDALDTMGDPKSLELRPTH